MDLNSRNKVWEEHLIQVNRTVKKIKWTNNHVLTQAKGPRKIGLTGENVAYCWGLITSRKSSRSKHSVFQFSEHSLFI